LHNTFALLNNDIIKTLQHSIPENRFAGIRSLHTSVYIQDAICGVSRDYHVLEVMDGLCNQLMMYFNAAEEVDWSFIVLGRAYNFVASKRNVTMICGTSLV
jgi:hypothetical protein